MRALLIVIATTIFGLGLFFSCGKDDTDRNQSQNGQSKIDLEATSEENDTSLTEAMDAVTEALADDVDLEGGGTLLSGSEADCTWTKNCDVDGTSAVVTRSIDCVRQRTFKRGEVSTTLSGELKRVWQKPQEGVTTCKNKHVDLDLTDTKNDDTSVNVSFERSWERTASRTSRKGETTSKSVRVDAKGTRDMTFSQLSATSRTKHLAMQVTRSRTVEGVAEKERVITATDLVITKKYAASTKEATSHTITSGSVTTTVEGGATLTKIFEDVKWAKIQENAKSRWCCVPVSGKLTAISKTPEGDETEKFTVTFAAADEANTCPESASLTVEDATPITFSNFSLDCDLNDD